MKALISLINYVFLVGLFFSFTSCGGCSKSGLKDKSRSNSIISTQSKEENTKSVQGKTIVKMQTESGVKFIWVEINGLRLKFIFDTGASSICISSAEATVLYRQGTLQRDDILEIQYFQDATGRVSAGTSINLRTVKIGDRILRNIEAIVIDNNEAPLLLGQSALEKFGKISIDNQKGEIIFE